ncbi:MAG: radical SAM protein [Polymorphobacter sp.]
MKLSQLLALRAVAAAGLAIGITRRCPLACAHCSTNSTTHSEQQPEALFRRFVDSFTAADHPQVLALSGGEAMLRPRLVRALAERTRAVGGRVTALSGAFFARRSRIPADIAAAIAALDHFSVSIDAFHEREVPREAVFALLADRLAAGQQVSLHTVADGADDPYVADLVAAVTARFGNRVPVMVSPLRFFGRARDWLVPDTTTTATPADPEPCAMAAWPVIGFDGTIVACGNDDALDTLPAHLRLGHAATDDWPAIRQRTQASAMLRAIRTFGPLHLAAQAGAHCDGYCATCMKLGDTPAAAPLAEAMWQRPSAAALEAQVALLQQAGGAIGFARRHGVPRYAELVGAA